MTLSRQAELPSEVLAGNRHTWLGFASAADRTPLSA
jgi:hypothetical protein